jgi:prepilin signal peptidase PulO-like enzyme (type II secretory pathway)
LGYLYFFGAQASENLRMTMFHTAQYGLFPHLDFWLLGQAIGVVVVLGALWMVTRGRAFGLGDAKYLGVLTIFFGFPANIIVLCVASVVGGGVSTALLVGGKATMKTKLPFGVFLSASATAYLFLGFWFFAHYSYLFVL